MRNRLSSFSFAWPAALALLLLLLAAVIVVGGRGGSETRTLTESGPATPSSKLIDWKLFGRVPQRLHYLPSELNPPLKQAWAYNDQALIEFPPAIANGRLYLVNKYSNVRALDAETGKVVWDLRRDRHYKGPASDVTAPVFGRQQVFVSFEDGTLLSLNASDAKIEWKRKLPTTLQSSPLVIGKTIYIGSDKGVFFALNTANGKTRWTFHVPHVIKASPSFDRGMVYFGDYGGAMFALRASDGREIWRVNTEDLPPGGDGGFYSSPAIANGRVYAGRDDGTVFALDQKTGKYSWSFQTGNFVYGSPAVADVPGTPGSTVYIGSYDHRLYAIDALSGKLRWRYDVGGSIPGTSVVIGHTVYTSSFAIGKSIGIDVLTHKKVFSFGSPGYTPMISDGQSLYLVGYYSLHRFEPKG
ncbi:MAG: PQQ-like beta-propeller repeat protein [Actinomycetota bacterium]|nr:PQQ-like beta-propeller repeat protein [Actinomycetota bacterium]